MVRDLAKVPGPVSELFPRLVGPGDWRRYRLADEQVALYHEQGFLAGPRLLDPAQIAALRRELEELADPAHPGHGLFYEFHSNESPDVLLRRDWGLRMPKNLVDIKHFRINKDYSQMTEEGVAERQGFEPWVELPPQHLSRVPPSAARPPLQGRNVEHPLDGQRIESPRMGVNHFVGHFVGP